MTILRAVATLGLMGVCTFSGICQQTLSERSDYTLFQNGVDLLEKERYGAARQVFQEYLDRYPDQLEAVDAAYYLAEAALNLYHQDAEDRFEAFIASHPNHPKAQLAYYTLGNFYYDQRKYKQAAEYYEQAVSANLSRDQQLEVYFRLGYAYFAQKKFEEAGRAFDQVKNTKHPRAAAASYYAGYVHLQAGNYEAALQDLRRAESDGAYQPLVPVMITTVYYQQGDFARVIDYGTAVLDRQKPNDADEIAMLVAESYYRQGNYAAAAPRFNQFAAQSRSIDAAVRYRVGYSNFMTEQYDPAIEQFKVVAGRNDSLGQNAAYHLGASYLRTGNQPYALTAFDQARKGSFDGRIREQALFNYAKITLEQRRYAEAIDAFKEFNRDFPRSTLRADANDLLSEAYLNTDNYEEAIAHIESTRQLTPRLRATYQQVTYFRATRLFNDKEFRAAIDMFEKSLKYPVDADLTLAAHFWTGETWSIGRKYTEAIASYATALALPQARQSAYGRKSHYGLGYAYFNTQEYGKALPHFQAYVEALEKSGKNENYDDALVRLADCRYVTKDYAGALRTYDEAIARKGPDRDYCYYQKGVVLGLMNRPEEARRQFEQVLTDFPRSRYRDDALIQQAQLDFEQGNYEAAVRGFGEVIRQQPNAALVPYAYLRRAIANGNLKRQEAAIQDYQKILTDYPTHATAGDALLGLQESLAAAGRMGEFDRYLARYKQANPGSNALESIEFEAAKSLYFEQKYAPAIARFLDYLRGYPNSTYVPDVRYYLGEAYFRADQPAEALRYHRQVISAGKGTFVDRSLDRAAELELAAGSYRPAVELYRRLLQNAANRRQELSAWLGLMNSYYQLDQRDSTRYFARQIIGTGNASLDAQHQATLLSGKVALKEKKYDEAIDFFLTTLNTAKDGYGAEAQYLMARIFYEQKNYGQSLETLYDLNQNFSQYATWLDQSFLLIADNFVAQGELFQARATLESIAEKSPSAQTRAAARARLEKLPPATGPDAPADTTFAN